METIYKDRDNKFTKRLLLDSTALTEEQMAAITKIEILYNGSYYDSDDFPDAFDWVTEAATGDVVFQLGEISTITVGRDKVSELIIYSADNPEGVVWATLDLKVLENI